MGLISFFQNAGSKLFGASSSDEEKATKVKEHLQSLGLSGIDGVEVAVKGDKVILSGSVANQTLKEKVVVAAGNVEGISHLEESVTVEQSGAESRFYEVVSGDTLSGISKKMYGDANKYMHIFEANKPMLKDPNQIYPGQQLIIPELD